MHKKEDIQSELDVFFLGNGSLMIFIKSANPTNRVWLEVIRVDSLVIRRVDRPVVLAISSHQTFSSLCQCSPTSTSNF